jgi:hypothetical protein
MSTKFTENRNLYHTFSRVAIQEGQGVAAAVNKTGHTVTTNDVWADIDKLPKNTTYFGNANTAFDDLKAVYDANATEFSKYVKLYENVELSPVDGSGQDADKNQAWELLVDGKRVKNFIAPTDVFDAKGQPCNGYTLKLFDKNGNQVAATDGNWAFDYVAGLVIFERGKTPQDTIWNGKALAGTTAGSYIKMSAWAYVGGYLTNTITDINNTVKTAVNDLNTKVNSAVAELNTAISNAREIAKISVTLKTGLTAPDNHGKTISSSISAEGVVTMTINAEVLTVKDDQGEIIQPDIIYNAEDGITTLTANYGNNKPTDEETWELTYRI